MHFRIGMFVVVVSLFCSATRAATLRLLPQHQTVKEGTRPAFRLEIRNNTHDPERFIDARNDRRPDLRDNYYELMVADPAGKSVNVPIAISDPGVVGEGDYFVLLPGESAIIDFPDSPLDLTALRSGKYVAWVEYRQYESASQASNFVRSTEATFQVKRRRK